MEIPEKFKDYDCCDYFTSDKFTRGFYDQYAQFWTFYTATNVREHPALEFLAIGGPGCDGLEWGYRKHYPGLWVFHPIEQRFQLLAPTLGELFDGWHSGKITL